MSEFESPEEIARLFKEYEDKGYEIGEIKTTFHIVCAKCKRSYTLTLANYLMNQKCRCGNNLDGPTYTI